MEYRHLFLRFDSPAGADTVAAELSEAFAAHLEFLRAHGSLDWLTEHDELTPPMKAFAQRAEFTWSEDDCFDLDGDPVDDFLDVTAFGHLVIISHAACSDLGQDGLRAFARRRGATAISLWDPDPEPIRIVLRSSSSEPSDDLLDEVIRICEDLDVETELSELPPEGDCATLVLRANSRTLYAGLWSGWGVAGLLAELGTRGDLIADLESS